MIYARTISKFGILRSSHTTRYLHGSSMLCGQDIDDKYKGYWTLILECNRHNLGTNVSKSTGNENIQYSQIENGNRESVVETETDDLTVKNPKIDLSGLDLNDPIIKELIDSLPSKPEPPDNCCMNGCSVCVWDLYQEDFTHFNENLTAWRSKTNHMLTSLSTSASLKSQVQQLLNRLKEVGEDKVEMDPTMKVFWELEKEMNKSENQSS